MVIVIKRKIVAIVAVVLLAAMMLVSSVGGGTDKVSALPTANRVIIIDAGHGGPDGGAIGGDNTAEKDLNLEVALKLQKLLEQSGCTVFMTRTEDISLSTPEDDANRQRKVADLANRKKMIDEYDVEAFVSIHMNTFSDPQYFGTQVFYSNSSGSKQLADYIQTEVCKEDTDNIRVAKDGSKNIFILSETSIPSVVVECGFLSNEKDLTRLKSEEYQSKLAAAIYNGITKFYS